ncbi:hypothetical protein [Rheinheimera sp.]|uniref:hypothetical protein n=1 Tax=Rheinheimera sp. TaxID=1869214 RepID=UPI002FDE6D1C
MQNHILTASFCKKYSGSQLLAVILFLLTAGTVQAQPLEYRHYYPRQAEPEFWSVRPLLAVESSDSGRISSVGLQWGGLPGQSVAVVTSLSFYHAKEQWGGSDIGFTNFDTSLRLGRFDDFSLYAEVGVALDELVFDEEETEYYDNFGYRHRHQGPIDWFAGVGGGLQLDFIQINAFARYRYLRSLEQQYYREPLWQQGYLPNPEPYQWFAGIELSFRF